MIYRVDLQRLADGEIAIPTDKQIEAMQAKCLLAIAERLEGFIESQKPRFVEIDVCDPDNPDDTTATIAFNDYSFDSVQESKDHKGYAAISMTSGRIWYVKGTLAEVMAKLRGEV